MCTKLEVKEVVHSELRETVPVLVGDVISKRVSKFLHTFWAVIIGLIISSAGAWFSLYYQVQQHSDKLNQGDRYSLQDHQTYAKAEREYVDQRFQQIENTTQLQAKSLEISIVRLETAVARLENIIIRNQ